jgi:signal transduction histidine kinase
MRVQPGRVEEQAEARTLSLRTRILWGALTGATLLVAGFLSLLAVSAHLQNQLAAATEAFVEEARIADSVSRNVMDQLAAAFALRSARDDELRNAFERAGREAHHHLRRYLFFDLTGEERLHLEALGEAHQLMEVAGMRAAELFARNLLADAEASWDQMIDHSRDVITGMDTFLGMRQESLHALQGQQTRTFRVLLASSGLLGLFVLLGAAFLPWTIHRRVAHPLREMARISERLGAGELDVRVPRWSDEEFNVLATGFNRMAESLEEATRSLEERNRQLSAALDGLQEAQEELIRSEKLGALGRMTAGLAHELNNPLTSVVGFSQLLHDRVEGLADGDGLAPEEVREVLHPILTEAARAQHLVRNLLLFSRRGEVELGAVHLGSVLDLVLGLRRRGFEDAGLEIRKERIPDVHVLADRNLLQSVLLNVVNNAFDAMRPEGSGILRIDAAERGGEVEIAFQDDGPGITSPDRVFEPFFTTKPAGEGTGLGLALAHRFMDYFGGEIRAENRDGGGARFVLTLTTMEPGEVHPAADGDAAPAVPSTILHAGSNGRPGTPLPSDSRILVVEDEGPIRELHRRLLARMGSYSLLAASAAEARTILDEERVDAVLCDVRMPGESGLELYRWISAERPDLLGRFLFVTGDVSDPELLELLEARPELFLHKPFEAAEYHRRVEALFAG